MLGLNEDARDHQIKACQQTEDSQVVKCHQCHKTKLSDNLCPLGKAWLTPLESER